VCVWVKLKQVFQSRHQITPSQLIHQFITLLSIHRTQTHLHNLSQLPAPQKPMLSVQSKTVYPHHIATPSSVYIQTSCWRVKSVCQSYSPNVHAAAAGYRLVQKNQAFGYRESKPCHYTRDWLSFTVRHSSKFLMKSSQTDHRFTQQRLRAQYLVSHHI